MTVKELLDIVDGTTNITFSTYNDILDKPLYEYPYLRIKSILDRDVRKLEVRWLLISGRATLYVEVAE